MGSEIDDFRRKFVVDSLSIGAFSTINWAGLLQSSHALGRIPSKLAPGRSIYQLEGLVLVDSKIASIDTRIGPNSVIKTGANSQIIFVVATDAFILHGDSELELTGSGFLIQSMRIITGKVLSVFGKRQEPHTITTSTATIGIRGTGIYIESSPDLSYICTCYGHTRITANADRNVYQDIIAEHHDAPLYVLPAASEKKLITSAPVINHTDKELALIETLVGRAAPFESNGGGYSK